MIRWQVCAITHDELRRSGVDLREQALAHEQQIIVQEIPGKQFQDAIRF